ncbi:MAG: hypothetical protein IJJ45_03365 [Clostridia bacterium]|nr:hypothetical protein [Clostridia bacterium]
MPRLWARIIDRQRIVRQDTRECHQGDVGDALTDLCREFDIPRPIWLEKHEREFAEFGRTRFLPEHFMEDVSFQRLEIEYLEDDDRSRRSRDPRNQFGD